MMPENQVKLALLEEYKKAMRYQDFYYEEVEVLSSLIRRAVQYYERQGLDIPERQEVHKLMEGLLAVVEKHSEFKNTVLPDESKHRDDFGLPDGEVTEPTTGFERFYT